MLSQPIFRPQHSYITQGLVLIQEEAESRDNFKPDAPWLGFEAAKPFNTGPLLYHHGHRDGHDLSAPRPRYGFSGTSATGSAGRKRGSRSRPSVANKYISSIKKEEEEEAHEPLAHIQICQSRTSGARMCVLGV